MIEADERRFVFDREQLVEKMRQRGARVRHPLAAHAVADVERQRQADRHALFRELRDRLRHAVLFDREVLLLERSEEHTSELQSQSNLVCRLLLEKKKKKNKEKSS